MLYIAKKPDKENRPYQILVWKEGKPIPDGWEIFPTAMGKLAPWYLVDGKPTRVRPERYDVIDNIQEKIRSRSRDMVIEQLKTSGEIPIDFEETDEWEPKLQS